MRRKRLMNLALVAAITVVWLLFAGLITWGLLNGGKRDRDLGTEALERLIGVQRSQLTMALRRVEQDLREEAAYVAGHDSASDAMLSERWLPLIESDWILSSIALASEAGEEQELARADDKWRFSSTLGGEVNAPPLVTEWPLRGSLVASRISIGEHGQDPRRSLWFGQALEDHATGATWSTTTAPDSTDVLHASMLIRSNQPDRPYRVIRFTLSPDLLVRSLGEGSATHSALYLGSEGHPWHLPDSGDMALALRAAHIKWMAERVETPFLFSVGHTDLMAEVVPLAITGTRIYTGAVVDMALLESWTHGERTALWSAAVLLALLGVLLISSFLHGQRRERKVERQEKQSLTQERKLAKVIGEREILDREVHHRVKNNLQVVSSLLNLQAERVTDAGTRHEFTRGKRRIDSMALVHHKLYAQTDLRAIDLRLFMDQIANAMRAMHEPKSRTVSHAVDTDGITANADTTIQLGIILCELLANCYLHAFPYVTGGHVDIILRKDEGDLYRLTVKDNGKGAARDPEKRASELGLELVEGLAEQIDGRMEITTDGGTRVDILFRMQGEAPVRSVK
jgi:two-component sensor histidine kinase